MIPVRLSVRNFMCYRDDAEVLDLTGVHLACLSGENGAGKSALLEAITWVLWGRARDRAIDDELIAKGATDMEVDLLFVLGGDTYRVIRKRAMKGKSGTTMLDLQIAEGNGADGGSWRALSGSTVRESQARINDLLKIDYDTFKNSAFLMQGKADEFTIKTPADRKKVLADILGLQQYDRLEEQAKGEAKDRLSRITDLNNTLYRINLEVERRPQYEADLKVLEEQLEAEQQHLTERRAELGEVTSREQALEHSRQRLEEIKERIARRERNMDGLKVRIVRNDERKKALQGLLERRDAIERGYAEMQDLLVRDEEFGEARVRLHNLQIAHGKVEREIDVERTRLESEANQQERHIADLKRDLAGRSVLEQQLADTLDKLNKLVALQAQHEDTRCEAEALDVKMRTLTTERDSLEQDGKLLRQKLDLLEKHFQTTDHAGCPLCGTALTEDALQRVRDSYEKDIADRRREYTEKQRELDEINRQIVAVKVRLGREQDQLKPLETYRRREAEQRAGVQRLDEDEQKLAGIE
ncbi:MAG TPA: SMC family ATPase, partial [Chloroflexia bacterium]|nr:SMC family ATPase [Chloroflexia bacterium]